MRACAVPARGGRAAWEGSRGAVGATGRRARWAWDGERLSHIDLLCGRPNRARQHCMLCKVGRPGGGHVQWSAGRAPGSRVWGCSGAAVRLYCLIVKSGLAGLPRPLR